MVRERSVAAARPQRQAAILGVKAAAEMLTSRKSAQQHQSRRQEVSRDNDGSEEDNANAESDDEDEDHSNDEEDESSMSELSEPEYDMDDSGTFGKAPSKRKRMPASTKKQTSTAASRRKAAVTKKSGDVTRRATTKKAVSKKGTRKAATRRLGNKEDLPIFEDNKLFNCIKKENENLKDIANDWIAYYIDNAPAALAQFVNCVLRSSGCNETVDEIQVEDTDEIVSVLSQIQEHFKIQEMPSYPLVSRAQTYKHFRRNLAEFIEHCFAAANEADVLLDDKLVDVLNAWIGSMTSSSYRAIRHTATVFALLMMGQMGHICQDGREPLKRMMKMRDAEKSKATPARARELDQQVRELDAGIKELDMHIKALFGAVFQHRFRDTDPTIRIECVDELGHWMKSLPDQFLTSEYLLYMGWTLTDPDEQVRAATIHGLTSLYARRGDRSSLKAFTTRFTPRLVEMATGDINVRVRVASINLVTHLNKLGVVDEAARDAISSHIFDMEPRVRAAVARYISDVVEAAVQAGDEDSDPDRIAKSRFKAIGAFIARLEGIAGISEDPNVDSRIPLGEVTRSRTAVAMGDLWQANSAIRDWKPLLELLQVDHSATNGVAAVASPGGSRKSRGNHLQTRGQSSENEIHLEPAEESVLVEALPIFMEKAEFVSSTAENKQRKTHDRLDANVRDEMTKDLIPIIDKIFNKYRTETGRIRDILLLPQVMNLDLFLEYQELGSYEGLWDQVVDQFSRHTEADVLRNAVDAVVALSATQGTSHLNEAKAQALREQTVADFCSAADALLQKPSEEYAEKTFCALLRLKALSRQIDVSTELEDTDENHQVSAWDALLKIAKTSHAMPQRSEELAILAIHTMSLYVMWKTRIISREEDSDAKDLKVADLADKRHDLLIILEGAIDAHTVATNSDLSREAYRELLDIHILYATMQAHAEAAQEEGQTSIVGQFPEKLRLTCEGSLQDHFAVFVAGEMKSFSEYEDDESMMQGNAANPSSIQVQARLIRSVQRQCVLVNAISHYVGAIRLGIIDLRHSIPLLANYGAFGHLYDACLRVLIEAIREAGIFQSRAGYACDVILSSLKQSFQAVRQEDGGEDNLVNLSRLLSSCLVVRGAQLAVAASFPALSIRGMHERGIIFALDNVKKAIDQEGGDHLLHALSFFKALGNLLVGLEARDAVAIKFNLTEALKTRSLNSMSTEDEDWDALRAYEKRLVTLASKSDTFAVEAQQADIADVNDGQSSPSVPSAALSRPRPRPRALARLSTASSQPEGVNEDMEHEDEEQIVEDALGVQANESFPDLTLQDQDMGMTSAMSLPVLDITNEIADDSSDNVLQGDAPRRSSQRPIRARRSRRNFDDSSDDIMERDIPANIAQKRARRS